MSGILNQTGAVSGILGTTVGTVGAADLSGVLPVGVTGGSGLTALGTVASGTIGSAVTGFSGIKNSSQWRITTTFEGDANPILNWKLADSPVGFGEIAIGGSVTESSGTFTFPTTGIWYILATFRFHTDSGAGYANFVINTTTNNSTYAGGALGSAMSGLAGGYRQHAHCSYMFDVTNTSTHKVQFQFDTVDGSNNLATDSSMHTSGATFLRLGDT